MMPIAAFKAGHIIADDAPVTIADGLKVPLKERTWHFVSNYVTDILTASRGGDHRGDAADLAAHEDRDGASCAVPLATILKNPTSSRQACGRDRDRRQCRPDNWMNSLGPYNAVGSAIRPPTG
jgi:hypothetical protein